MAQIWSASIWRSSRWHLRETTPVLEAAKLQDDLRRAGIEPWAWIINNSVAAAHTHSPLLLQRAANERRAIQAVTETHARRYALVPLLKDEPVGQKLLRALSQRQGADTERDCV